MAGVAAGGQARANVSARAARSKFRTAADMTPDEIEERIALTQLGPVGHYDDQGRRIITTDEAAAADDRVIELYNERKNAGKSISADFEKQAQGAITAKETRLRKDEGVAVTYGTQQTTPTKEFAPVTSVGEVSTPGEEPSVVPAETVKSKPTQIRNVREMRMDLARRKMTHESGIPIEGYSIDTEQASPFFIGPSSPLMQFGMPTEVDNYWINKRKKKSPWEV